MSEKRFVVIEVWQGEEDILRSRYAHLIHTGGSGVYADGVKYAYLPVEGADVSGIKVYDDAMKQFKQLRGVVLEDVK
jgi:hypothetical protein